MTASFAKQDRIFSLIAEMGGQAETELNLALEVLARGNQDLLGKIAAADRRVDGIEREVNDLCFEYIAQHGPQAEDLRGIFAALKISLHLERIGDYARNIAMRGTVLDAARMPAILSTLRRMGQLSQRSLGHVLDACLRRDAELAQNVWKLDEDIDAFYNSLFTDIVETLSRRPGDAASGTHLLFVARNLERIGDHISNIAEVLYYWVTGKRLEGTRTVYDETAAVMPAANADQDGTKGYKQAS